MAGGYGGQDVDVVRMNILTIDSQLRLKKTRISEQASGMKFETGTSRMRSASASKNTANMHWCKDMNTENSRSKN